MQGDAWLVSKKLSGPGEKSEYRRRCLVFLGIWGYAQRGACVPPEVLGCSRAGGWVLKIACSREILVCAGGQSGAAGSCLGAAGWCLLFPEVLGCPGRIEECSSECFVCSVKLLAFSGEMPECPRKFLGCSRKVLGCRGALLEVLGFPWHMVVCLGERVGCSRVSPGDEGAAL